jgi:hypothetical protein
MKLDGRKRVATFAFHPTRSVVCVCYIDGRVVLWDYRAGRVLSSVEGSECGLTPTTSKSRRHHKDVCEDTCCCCAFFFLRSLLSLERSQLSSSAHCGQHPHFTAAYNSLCVCFVRVYTCFDPVRMLSFLSWLIFVRHRKSWMETKTLMM